MPLKKCPKCELNYLLNDEAFCTVCSGKVRPITYVDEDDTEICSNCGEQPALRGEEYCAECLAEFTKGQPVTKPPTASEEDADAPNAALKVIDDVDVDVPTFDLPEIRPEIDVDEEELEEDAEGEDDEDNLYLSALEEEEEEDDEEEDDL